MSYTTPPACPCPSGTPYLPRLITHYGVRHVSGRSSVDGPGRPPFRTLTPQDLWETASRKEAFRGLSCRRGVCGGEPKEGRSELRALAYLQYLVRDQAIGFEVGSHCRFLAGRLNQAVQA